LKLAENTYLIFTTDNGPWLTFKHHGGSAGPLREGKGTTFEGGQRVPCVMWAPGRIPAGTTCDQLCGTIDLLPTIASLTKTPLPSDKKIDGIDISALLDSDAKTPRHEFVYYTSTGNVEGLRQGKHKLLVKKRQVFLFDLEADMGEKNNLAESMPELVEKLEARMLELDTQITKEAREPWIKN